MTKLYDHLLDSAESFGISALFGIPDPGLFHLFNAAKSRGWTVVAPHHESAAGFMAEGWSRIMGRPAMVAASLGPGFANMVPAMMHAMAECSPILFIAGRRAGMPATAQRGRFQHAAQLPVAAAAVKHAASLDHPADAPHAIARALCALREGTPGPAYLEIPPETMLASVNAPPAQPITPPLPDLSAALALIATAQNPIILAGHAISTARAAHSLTALAQKLGCPVLRTPGGCVPDSLPYGPDTRAIIAPSDLVIAIGTQLGDQVHYGRERHWRVGNTDRQWIHIESDAQTIGQSRPIDVALIGDLAQILPAITAQIPQRRANAPAALPRAAITPHTDPIHPATLIAQTHARIPPNAILIRDGGAFVLHQMAQDHPAADLLWSQNSGHLGTGLPMAIGAMLAAPGRPALLMTGDSAMLFHISELETAAREGLPLVCVVAVDHQWGLEAGMSRRLLGPSASETGLHWGQNVRFDAIARGFGCDGAYVTHADEIGPALSAAFAAKRPTVIHAEIDPRANADDMPGMGEFASWFSA